VRDAAPVDGKFLLFYPTPPLDGDAACPDKLTAEPAHAKGESGAERRCAPYRHCSLFTCNLI
jgi:hypothetical protein